MSDISQDVIGNQESQYTAILREIAGARGWPDRKTERSIAGLRHFIRHRNEAQREIINLCADASLILQAEKVVENTLKHKRHDDMDSLIADIFGNLYATQILLQRQHAWGGLRTLPADVGAPVEKILDGKKGNFTFSEEQSKALAQSIVDVMRMRGDIIPLSERISKDQLERISIPERERWISMVDCIENALLLKSKNAAVEEGRALLGYLKEIELFRNGYRDRFPEVPADRAFDDIRILFTPEVKEFLKVIKEHPAATYVRSISALVNRIEACEFWHQLSDTFSLLPSLHPVVQLKDSGAKSQAAAMNKVEHDYEGDWSLLKDGARANVLFSDPHDMVRHHDLTLELARGRGHIVKEDNGYRMKPSLSASWPVTILLWPGQERQLCAEYKLDNYIVQTKSENVTHRIHERLRRLPPVEKIKKMKIADFLAFAEAYDTMMQDLSHTLGVEALRPESPLFDLVKAGGEPLRRMVEYGLVRIKLGRNRPEAFSLDNPAALALDNDYRAMIAKNSDCKIDNDARRILLGRDKDQIGLIDRLRKVHRMIECLAARCSSQRMAALTVVAAEHFGISLPEEFRPLEGNIKHTAFGGPIMEDGRHYTKEDLDAVRGVFLLMIRGSKMKTAVEMAV